MQNFSRLVCSLSVFLLSGLLFAPCLYAQLNLTQLEEQELLYLREEEKLARDVYTALYASSSLQIFSNISQSEQRHMNAALSLLQTYGLTDPVGSNAAGVFTNSELQSLYDQLVAQGAASQIAALQVGVLIEETDIADLEAAIGNTDKPDVIRVYNNLLKGSRNHLSAFTNNLAALGGEPNPGQGNSNLDPGTSVYEPISETLYLPALNFPDGQGGFVVYDVMFRLVETLPQTLELIAINTTNKLASDIHASYDPATEILTVPRLQVGALSIDSVAQAQYSANLSLVENSPERILFSLVSLAQL
ncbi:MAG: DUF2202 domain-containing protein [Proteobacteria bacterium]|nr:DUF2202 domain-containing protein [Pseudomonadota bacterium]